MPFPPSLAPSPSCDCWHALRWNNAPSYEPWLKEIETVRWQGYSIDRGIYIAGVTMVAVPGLNAKGTISHTLASAGLSDQIDRTSSVALAHDTQTATRTATG